MNDAVRDLPNVHEWGIRRRSGGITTSSREWATDVAELTGLPIVHWNGTEWIDA